MSRWLQFSLSTLLLVVAALWPVRGSAEERILSFDSDITVLADGSVDVTETIRVRGEGRQIRKGIVRDFPTRYRDRRGTRVVVGFELLGVTRDGRQEPYFTEDISNGVRINTGDDSFLELPADITYTIRYRTSRQMGYFKGHDELYWNVTGLGSNFPIDEASARVRLPQDVPAAELHAEGYTGPMGSKGQNYVASVDDGGAVYTTTQGLGPREGLTIVLTFPKGIIKAPSGMRKALWLLKDNRGVLIALLGLIGLLAFYGRRWSRLGRDPAAGSIFPQYEPPEGWSPAELRYLRRMGYDNRCFAADLVDMAVHGGLNIHNEGKKDWRLTRDESAGAVQLPPAQQAIGETLFARGDELVLTNRNASTIGGAQLIHHRTLGKRLKPDYYVSNASTTVIGVAASIVYGWLAFLVAGGTGVLWIVLLLVLALGAHIGAGILMQAPTQKGRELLDRIEGLRLYLSVAEKDELKAVQGPAGDAPPLDAGRYESLLPYALALDVEDAWTAKFTAAVGVAAAAAAAGAMHWYHGNHSSLRNLGDMNRALGSALSQQISSSSTPPGSSSGSGGGGSSGGGGGGGGVGGR